MQVEVAVDATQIYLLVEEQVEMAVEEQVLLVILQILPLLVQPTEVEEAAAEAAVVLPVVLEVAVVQVS